MRSTTLLYCPGCVEVTHHTTEGRFDSWGHLTGTVDRCSRCGKETQTGQGDWHEAPAADPPPVTSALTDTEIKRCLLARRLIARGFYSDWYGAEPIEARA